jgi:hypothetical protein
MCPNDFWRSAHWVRALWLEALWLALRGAVPALVSARVLRVARVLRAVRVLRGGGAFRCR